MGPREKPQQVSARAYRPVRGTSQNRPRRTSAMGGGGQAYGSESPGQEDGTEIGVPLGKTLGGPSLPRRLLASA